MRRAIRVVVAVGGLVVGAHAGVAQGTNAAATKAVAPGAFVGFIKNLTDSTPVRSADIRLYFLDSVNVVRGPGGASSVETFIDTSRSRLGVSNETGYFAIWRLVPARYVMTVRRIGFAPTEAIVTVDSGTVVYDFTMEPVSAQLSKVEIKEDASNNLTRRLDHVGFTSRARSSGEGQFVKPGDIMKRQPQTLRDILNTYGLTSSAEYVLDKMALEYDDIVDYPAEMIAGIEIYRHNRPIEHSATRRGRGVMASGPVAPPLVIIWTYVP